MRPRYFHVLVVAAVMLAIGAALFASACGGSDDTKTTEPADTPTTSAVEGTDTTEAALTGENGSIVVAGLVDYPMNFTVLDMDYMDWTTVTATDPDGVEGQYEGVPLNAIFDYVGVQSDATTMVLTASDGSTVEVALADVPTEESILTVGENDALNTVMPGLDSGWVEDVVKMEFK
jgi:hypothetical protein